MNLLAILADQLTDPFRIGLLFILVLTARNTAAQTGMVIPIALGVAFVALLIPSTMADEGQPFWPAVLVGIVTNAIVVAVALALVAAWTRIANRRA